jgi:NTP pyrophosphatase (non-canonical NTP hydrolase)
MSKDELSAALAACAADLQAFADARDWGQFHTPKNLAMSLAIEAGEVMEHFQWTAPDAATLSPEARAAVALELADVFSYLLRLASVLEIDLASALRTKLAINEQRYPVEKARGSATKYDAL